jgi:hypothetical protein
MSGPKETGMGTRVNVTLTGPMKKALKEELASTNGRGVATYIQLVVSLHLEEKGYNLKEGRKRA